MHTDQVPGVNIVRLQMKQGASHRRHPTWCRALLRFHTLPHIVFEVRHQVVHRIKHRVVFRRDARRQISTLGALRSKIFELGIRNLGGHLQGLVGIHSERCFADV